MKVNPWDLPRPKRPAETRTFGPFSLTLRAADTCDAARAGEKAQQLVEMFITGANGLPPAEFPHVGGEPVQPTGYLFTMAATIWAMQCPQNPAEAYTCEELVALSVARPAEWLQVLAWTDELAERSARGENDPGNGLRAPTG